MLTGVATEVLQTPSKSAVLRPKSGTSRNARTPNEKEAKELRAPARKDEKNVQSFLGTVNSLLQHLKMRISNDSSRLEDFFEALTISKGGGERFERCSTS